MLPPHPPRFGRVVPLLQCAPRGPLFLKRRSVHGADVLFQVQRVCFAIAHRSCEREPEARALDRRLRGCARQFWTSASAGHDEVAYICLLVSQNNLLGCFGRGHWLMSQ